MTQRVWIPTRDGQKLEGLVRKPEGKGPFPIVVFVAGLGMTMHEWNNSFDEIAQRLVDRGIMTLQFQLPTFDAQGNSYEVPISQRATKVEEVFSWFSKQKDILIDRIGVVAQSYGVTTALAANLPNVRTAVWVGGAYAPKNSLAKAYEEEEELRRSSGKSTIVGKAFWEDVRKFDDVALAQGIHFPILVIHGDKDNKIPVSDAKMVFDAIASKKKKIIIFKGGDHSINEVPRAMREEFLEDVVQWFKTTL